MTIVAMVLVMGTGACNKANTAPHTHAPIEEEESLTKGSSQQARVEQLIADRSYADAVALADELLVKHPKDPGLYYAKAAALSRLERGKEARDSLERAIEVDARFVPAYVALARALAFGRGALDEGLGYAQKAVQIDDRQPEALLVLAMIQHDRGDKKAAIATLEGALDRGVQSMPAYTELGRLYAAQGAFEKSRKALSVAIRRLPPAQSVPTRLLLGRVELSAKQGAAAKEAFDGAIAAQPKNFDIPLAVIRAYLVAKQPQQAKPYAQAVLAAMPEQAPALVAMARVQLGLGEIEGKNGALHWIDKARTLAPQSPAVRYAHALILAQAGRCAQAKESAAGLERVLNPTRAQELRARVQACH